MTRPNADKMRPSTGLIVFALLASTMTVGVAGQANSIPLISESDGRVGIFQLDSAVERYGAYLKRIDSPDELRALVRSPAMAEALSARTRTPTGTFVSSADGRFFVLTDGSRVTEVITTSPETFTERFIRPQISVASDVWRSYGDNYTVKNRNGVSILSYGRLHFWFVPDDPHPESRRPGPGARVYAVSLRQESYGDVADGSSHSQRSVYKNQSFASQCVTPQLTCMLLSTVSIGEPCSCMSPVGNLYGIAR